MRNRYLLIIIGVFLFSTASFADHIVGGSLTYDRIGLLNYRITLTLYRDCGPLKTNFPSSVIVAVVKTDGSVYTTVTMMKGTVSSVPQNIDSCVLKSPICLQVATYSKTVSLPPNASGYYIFEQGQCCRNPNLINIENAIKAGETFYAKIPDPAFIPNSSPSWKNPMPAFVCQAKNINLDLSAIDFDKDSLRYSFYTPYDSGKVTFAGGVFTARPLFWKPNYGANNPLDPTILNSLKISNKGIITGVPPTAGLFLIGVRCEEYRSGVKIGEILVDFQLNVMNCPPIPDANFNIIGACKGKKITFINTTYPSAKTYFWNFGNLATLADTSHLIDPIYNYPSINQYTVTLITNKGTACADTSIQLVKMPVLKAKFTQTIAACEDSLVTFKDASTLTSGNVIDSWVWDFGDSTFSTTQNPKQSYKKGNVYTVKLIVSASGCSDTSTSLIAIQKKPLAIAGNDTMLCANNAVINLGGKIQNATSAMWLGSGSFSPNNLMLGAMYTPTLSAINKGFDTLKLITTANGLCSADTDNLIISFYKGPTVNVGNNFAVCKSSDSIGVCATVTFAKKVSWQSTGSGFFINPANVCSKYLPSIGDKNKGYITLYATTTDNGNCKSVTDSVIITFQSASTASISSQPFACENQLLKTKATVSTNRGVWTSSGMGKFFPNDTTLNATYQPSTTDKLAKSINLIFTSTNNGNCKAAIANFNVTLEQAPKASYTSENVCLGKSTLFTDTSIPVEKINSWKWSFGDSAYSALKSPTHTYLNLNSYDVRLIVTSKNNCADTIIKSIQLYNIPFANYKALGGCLNDSVIFTDSSKLDGDFISNWYWQFENGGQSTLKYPRYKFSSAGNYQPMLRVTSSHGCIDSISKPLVIMEAPITNFSPDKITANANQVINFRDNSKGAVTWHWNFGDSIGFSNLQHPSYHYSSTGIYKICLTTSNYLGCADTTCQVEIITVRPGVPSAFSPNNDGNNDELLVYGGTFSKLIFKVYNNWGQLVFESTNQLIGWNGKCKGIDQPIGIYVYTLYCISEDGKEHQLSGDVTLTR
ncbi:MAG: PKD domain-containing protein [Bacteroidia bacterium]